MSNEQKPVMPAQTPEDIFQNLFSGSVSGSGEEELLRIASKYSLQLSGPQIRVILKLVAFSMSASEEIKKRVKEWLVAFIEYKQYNNSNAFVMRALENIALRKLVNEVQIGIRKE